MEMNDIFKTNRDWLIFLRQNNTNSGQTTYIAYAIKHLQHVIFYISENYDFSMGKKIV